MVERCKIKIIQVQLKAIQHHSSCPNPKVSQMFDKEIKQSYHMAFSTTGSFWKTSTSKHSDAYVQNYFIQDR